jgi:hypothetical protein
MECSPLGSQGTNHSLRGVKTTNPLKGFCKTKSYLPWDHNKSRGGVTIGQSFQPRGEYGKSTYPINGLYKRAKSRRMKIGDYTMNVKIKPLMLNF